MPEPSRSLRIELPDNDRVRALCGAHNEHLKLIERRLGVQLGLRGGQLMVGGEDPARLALAERLLRELYGLLEEGFPLHLEDVDQATKLAEQGVPLREVFGDTVFVSARHRVITPKGLAQKRYVQAIRDQDIVFGIGPAGTGKTYLAMAMAVAVLVERKVKRIVLTRPAVEAGERLGFLPGDIAEKVNPYLRPLHDALFDMVDDEKASAFIERGTIEVAPLAFMRGRTLNDAFIILDEAQNTTARADEDVPHAARLRLQGGGHRRRDAGGPAERAALRAAGGPEGAEGGRGDRVLHLHGGGRGPPPAGAGGGARLRDLRGGATGPRRGRGGDRIGGAGHQAGWVETWPAGARRAAPRPEITDLF